ncbi:FAD/NAD(P)-binding oxidoreductase, partial [Pseudomonas aeruginosa]
MSADYDLLIVGAGPAGLAAALAAAPSGARIALVDDNPAAGGQIWRDGPRANLPPRAHQMRQRLAGQANVEHFPATRVVACGPGRRLLLEDPQRGWQVGYRRLVLCTGARELLLPFPGWTLPGVTGAGSLQALAKGGLPLAGQRLVVAGSGPLLLASAASASQCGARLLRVAEQAPARTLAAFAVRLPRWPGKLWQAAGLFARSYRADSYVLAALGEERLEAVRLREGGRVREIACERLACGFGLVPNVQLGQALGYRLDGQALAVDEWQAGSLPDHYAAGECTGFGGSELALVEGAIAGHAAVDERDAARRLWPRRRRWQGFADTLARHFALRAELRELAEADTLV